MSRLLALSLVAAFAGPAAAQKPRRTSSDAPAPTVAPAAVAAPAAAAPAMPAMPANTSPTLTLARVVDGQLELTVTKAVPVQMMVTVQERTAGGETITKAVPVTQIRTVMVKERQTLTGKTVTGTDGKKIPADKLAELLSEESVIVVTYGGPVAERYRGAFRDGTVFVAFPPQMMPVTEMPKPLPPAQKPKTTPLPKPE